MSEPILEKDAVGKIIDLCRNITDDNVRRIVLGLDYMTEYDSELRDFERKLRATAIHREKAFNRIVNLAFAYLIAKYSSLKLKATSNCEARIQHVVEHLYSAYNITDDVVEYVILNIALGLDASETFRNNFDAISANVEFYKNTNEYINIFKHTQKLRQSPYKTKSKIMGSNEWLYKLFSKLRFICRLQIVECAEYRDNDSAIAPCAFKIDGQTFPAKYSLVCYTQNEYSKKFLFLRGIDEVEGRERKKRLRLSFTDIGETDTSEDIKVFVGSDPPPPQHRDRCIMTTSIGRFYSYITGDLLRKRHRMSFCNGLSSYKYYGELAASVMDALEMLVPAGDKQLAVVENYILPVVKNNFNICKDDCVCTGVGCKRGARERLCSMDKLIELKGNLTAGCLMNMNTVSILTILFSVVGCREILPQIFAQYTFTDISSYDNMFNKVNEQLDKRFSEFNAGKVEALRQQFYKKSIDYLSLDLNEAKNNNKSISQSLKPFKIKAYTDALIACLENLDRDKTECNVNPNENVYSIQSKIDLVNSMSDIVDARSALRDTLKIILAYYAGLANCTQEQLSYEIQAEQSSSLSEKTVNECRTEILEAFMSGVDKKLKILGKAPSFYTLFKCLVDDNNDMKSEISIMLGRSIVNANALKRFIILDDEKKTCKLVLRSFKDNSAPEITEWNLDDEIECRTLVPQFVARVVELLNYFKGDGQDGVRSACYPQVLTHTSSRVNVDNTTISSFTVYESEQYTPQREYNVITYFTYEISKHYYYIVPKKFEKTRWITYPILIRCSDFYNRVIKENMYE